MQPLRDYQARAKAQWEAHWANGARRVLLVSPTGSGKTRMGEEGTVGATHSLWLAHRNELIRDASERLRASFGHLEVGIIAAGAQPSPYSRIQVTSVQTIINRNESTWPIAERVIADECFPAGTLVGGRPIETLRAGDMVPSVDHITGSVISARVSRVMMNQSHSLMVLGLGSTELRCTRNHPIFVKGVGYVEASNLLPGDLLCVLEDVHGERREWMPAPEDLRSEVSRGSLIGDHVQYKSCARSPKNAGAQPDEESRGSRESQQGAARHEASPESTGRKRPGSNRGGASCVASVGVANECDRENGSEWPGIPGALQTRRSIGGAQDCRGSRREQSLRGDSSAAGSQKGKTLAWVRLDRIAHQQFGRLVTVWNLEIEGSHTYFADGVLVHNCHHFQADKWSRVLAHYSEALHLGLTATPERQDGKAMSGAYDVMAVAANYSELLQAGYLCGVRVFRPDHIMGANTLALDPVEAWLKYSEGSPGFAFFGSVDSAYEYEHKMNAAGIRAAVVEGFTEKAKRLEAIDALRNGELDCICNVYTMTEGVDVPNARVCMLAARLQHVGGYLQRVGRVLRSHASKENAILIDLVGASTLHGLPTEDRIYSLNGDAIKRQDITPLRGCKVCGAQVPSAFAACTECGTPFPVKSREQAGPKIYSLELREVYAGKDTPPDAKRAEYKRIRAMQKQNGYPLYWLQKQYEQLFGEKVMINDATNEEKRSELAKFRAIGQKRGARPNFAKVMFKNTFGHWPSG